MFVGSVGMDERLLFGSDAGGGLLPGAWGWYRLLIVMWIFNTLLGEELLFAGYFSPE